MRLPLTVASLQEEPVDRIVLLFGSVYPKLPHHLNRYFSKDYSLVTIGMFSAMAWATACRSKGS
jgi:hypothetical protein